jgi:hypothetical protein
MKSQKLEEILSLIQRKLNSIMLFEKISSLFAKEEKQKGVVIVEREEFAERMREKFKGNRELLKAIEKCMNRAVEKHEYVSLTDFNRES